MNELALFAGAGGGILGTELLGWRVVCAVELDPYRREILLRRQEDGHLPPFPVWDDIRTFCGFPWRGAVDVVSAGFPCQPFSQAGRRRGADDERNLWPETLRVIDEVRPRFAFLENVPGLAANPYFRRILLDLAEIGFDAEWDRISAASQGAPHIRDRLWIVAHAQQKDLLAHPNGTRSAHIQGSSTSPGTSRGKGPGRGRWWDAEPDVGRVADGVALRVDRLGALGDGQVPAVVRRAWEMLTRT